MRSTKKSVSDESVEPNCGSAKARSNLYSDESVAITAPEKLNIRGLSSAGRASALQAEGHRFEPYRPHYMGEFPSGQRGQTVNLLATLSVVRIHLPPFDAGWSSPEARRAHNPEVAGSNPVPATFLSADWRLKASLKFTLSPFARKLRLLRS